MTTFTSFWQRIGQDWSRQEREAFYAEFQSAYEMDIATAVTKAILAEREACATLQPPYSDDEADESCYADGFLEGWRQCQASIRARGEE